MSNLVSNNSTITPEKMIQRYQQAQALMLGKASQSIACNTTVIPHWIGDTDCFWYAREFTEGKEFRLVDAKEHSNTIAFNHADFSKALAKSSGKIVNAKDLPITKIVMTASPLSLVFTAFEKRWHYTEENRRCNEIDVPPENWLISPDGTKAAFTKDDNIWLRDIASGEESALTEDGEPFYSYGASCSAWGIQFTVPKPDAIWSPDSKRLLTLQLDTRKVKTLPVMHYVPSDGSHRPYVSSLNRRFTLPGDPHIDEYRFLAIDVDSGRQQDVHYRRCPVFRNALGFFSQHHGWWSADNRHAYFIDLERYGDHVARLVEFDTHTGATRVVIEEESSDVCFKLRLDSRVPIHTRPLPGSHEAIWFSERSGWGHLYLYDLETGECKNAITQGNWVVREIGHYDTDRRELIIQTAGRVDGRDPYYCDLCRVNIDTGKLTPIVSSDHEYILFDEGGELAVNLGAGGVRDIWGGRGSSPTGRYLVSTRSRVDEIPETILFDHEGQECLTVEVADVSSLPDGWQWPERVELLAEDRKTKIVANVFRPTHFSPEQSYPVINNSLALKESGFLPSGSFTNNAIAGASYFFNAALAELGFIVVDMVGRGCTNRSREFFSSSECELPQSDFQADCVAGIRQLIERYPYMDVNRIGAGGMQSTNIGAGGLLGYPDFYKVGVSNSALTGSELAPAFVGESYCRLPMEMDSRPRTIDYANNLKGRLLLIHGLLNPVVSAACTFALADALQKANKNFDMLVLPNDGYSVSSYAIRRTWDYFVTYLLDAEPPVDFELETNADIMAKAYAKRLEDAAS